MESFFGSLKNELVHRATFPTRETARRAIFEYVEVFGSFSVGCWEADWR
jgi:transposase InsO family protein